MSLIRNKSGIHGRGFLCAVLVAIGALLATATSAMAGAPTGETFTSAVSPPKQDAKAFGPASLHIATNTTYDDFTGSPGAKETDFTLDKNLKFVNGNTPPCSNTTLNTATTTAAVQAACGASIVGQGFQLVNNGSGAYPGQQPVLLVSGGPTTLYIWSRIASSLTVVVTGVYNPSANTIDVTGLPNTPGADLTAFDATFNKKKTGKNSYYVMARCNKKKKIVNSVTTTFYNGQQLSATATQKCKQKKSKKKK
jgi:hypothetical protein